MLLQGRGLFDGRVCFSFLAQGLVGRAHFSEANDGDLGAIVGESIDQGVGGESFEGVK